MYLACFFLLLISHGIHFAMRMIYVDEFNWINFVHRPNGFASLNGVAGTVVCVRWTVMGIRPNHIFGCCRVRRRNFIDVNCILIDVYWLNSPRQSPLFKRQPDFFCVECRCSHSVVIGIWERRKNFIEIDRSHNGNTYEIKCDWNWEIALRRDTLIY